MEFAPGIHHIPDVNCNVYLVDSGERLILIDCGMPDSHELIREYMAQIGRDLADLDAIVLTHADLDHVGSVARLQADSGATVYLGARTRALVVAGRKPRHTRNLWRNLLSRFYSYDSLPEEALEVVEDGDRIPAGGELRAIASPGHTADHYSYYCERSGVLFAGDALFNMSGELQLTPPFITLDETSAGQSALKLLRLAPTAIACGHGDVIISHSGEQLMKVLWSIRDKQ